MAEYTGAVHLLLSQLKDLNRVILIVQNVEEFLALGALPQVRALDLSCHHITSLSRIEDWKQLTSFDLGYLGKDRTQLEDISPLAALTDLIHLTFRRHRIRDITALAAMKSLRTLTASTNDIRDISPLAGLTHLTELSMTSNPIDDITPLRDLKKLTQLHLDFTNITDISPLENLTALTHLCLNSDPLSGTDALSGLVNIRFLYLHRTGTQNISFLKNYHALECLYLNDNGIKDLSPLRALSRLTELVIDNNEISDLSDLKDLTSLRALSLRANQIIHFDRDWLKSLPALTSLTIRDNPITNIPSHIFQYANCLEDVSNYFSSLEAGETATFESKLILVGNGRVGKTCLVKRWLDNTFDLNEPSTHAIQLRSREFQNLAGHTGLANARLNIWDFGGQDIYHATHRLFMRTEAIFLLVWDTQTEKEEWQSEGEMPVFRNQRLSYWLSYIRALSPGSPVLLVQTKEGRDGVQISPLSEVELQEYNVQGILSIDSSKGFLNGLDILDTKVQQLMARQIEETCTIFPTSWIHIREKITALQEKEVRQLPLAEFQAFCRDQGLDESTTNTLLNYFHNSGVFFYRKGLFNDQIVLDQKWAIDAVYALFDRKGLFLRLQKDGLFKGADLQIAWKNFTENEQELFLSFMQQCEICYEPDRWNSQTHFAERTFIAPQLLSYDRPDTVKFAFRKIEGIYYRYQFPFLQPAIIQRFIVRVGRMAELQNMWRNGIILTTPEDMALVEAFPEKREILIRLEDHKRSSLLNKIRNEMKDIAGEEADVTESVSFDGETFANLADLKDHYEKFSQFSAFLHLDEKVRFNKPEAHKTLRIFLSSSLDLQSDREKFEQFIGRENKKQKGPFLELIICEDFPDHLTEGGLMEAYKQSIRECHLFVLLYHSKVGKYTGEEFDTAYNSFKNAGHPIIYTYYKDEPLPANITRQDIDSKFTFEEKLRTLGHFPTKYKNPEDLILHFKNQREKYLSF